MVKSLARAVLQNKKAAIDDLEIALADLEKDLSLAFERQETIEVEIRSLKMGKLEVLSLSSHMFTNYLVQSWKRSFSQGMRGDVIVKDVVKGRVPSC